VGGIQVSVSESDEAERSAIETLLHPKSVALIGVSDNAETLGGRPLGFLDQHKFPGTVYPVNPRATVQGRQAYGSVLQLPSRPDVAMVTVRADRVPAVLRDCAAAGVKVAILCSSGFGEGLGGGAELRDEIAEILERSEIRVLGPNCEGLASLPAAAPLTFSPVLDVARTGRPLKEGGVAVLSQSGGLGFAVAQWGSDVGVGFRYIVSTGNELDLDLLDFAAYLAEDPGTEVVAMLVEGFDQPERFEAIRRRYSELGKLLVVVKLGSSPAGVAGARAHTGHVAGDPGEYDRLFDGEGVLRASNEEELTDILQALSKSPKLPGPRIGIVSTSGGAGVWTADACHAVGLNVPVLSEATQERLIRYMPAYGSPVNPVDLTAQFFNDGVFAPVLEAIFESGEVDGVIVVTSLATPGRLDRDREALEALSRSALPLIIFSYTHPAPSTVSLIEELGLPWYSSSARAARGLASLLRR
jgi:acyl-CoA synthetase (NDP forming)